MATVERPQAEQQTWLHAVPWETYVQLRDAPENDHVRMIYDQGELEIMSPSRTHEQYARFIGVAIDLWTLERNIDIAGCRTMTCKRRDLQLGFEPDNCYYVANELLVRGKGELDFTVDPPPDLAIEVDLSGRPRHKLAIYAAFGVPEVWWFDGHNLHLFVRADDVNYQERPASPSFPGLPPVEIEKLLANLGAASETALMRTFRDWVRTISP